MKDVTRVITAICFKINAYIGSPWTFLCVLIFVTLAYLVLPFQGYERWNTGIGLFANTTGSNAEFIIDVGIAVSAMALRKQSKDTKKSLARLHAKHDEHAANVAALHEKVDALVEKSK